MATFTPLSIPGVILIQPKVFGDARGYFYESFQKNPYESAIGSHVWVQENVSSSTGNVLRGLHYQIPPFAQNKLVSVLYGKVVDVCVDLRKSSPTFGRFFMQELSDENHTQLFIPKGLAHGFLALTERVVFSYKVDAPYAPESERGIFPADQSLAIPWPLPEKKWLLSPKDQKLPPFSLAEIFP